MRPAPRLLAVYLAVTLILIGWWVALQAAAGVSLPLTVAVAYAAPALVWLALRLGAGASRARATPRTERRG